MQKEMKNIYGPIRGKCPIHTDTISNYNLIIKVSSNFYLPALTHILILQSCGKLGRRGRVGWVGWAGLGQIINKRPPRPIITERRLDGTAALSFFAENIVANLGISSYWQWHKYNTKLVIIARATWDLICSNLCTDKANTNMLL